MRAAAVAEVVATSACHCESWRLASLHQRWKRDHELRLDGQERRRVKSADDIDAAVQFTLGAVTHRFSNTSAQTGVMIGMVAALMQRYWRAFLRSS